LYTRKITRLAASVAQSANKDNGLDMEKKRSSSAYTIDTDNAKEKLTKL
jgi:hypothetical protein